MPRRDDLPILPSTTVASLLDRYPELENVLIALAPPFRKLKNPILRKGVAKVATLQQAAAVSGMPVNRLIDKLRAALGQQVMNQEALTPETVTPENADESLAYFASQPAWFAAAKIVASIDEGAADPDQMPIVAVLQRAAQLQAGEALELVTAFLPAPGIAIMKKKGFRVWSMRAGPQSIRTYVSKPQP